MVNCVHRSGLVSPPMGRENLLCCLVPKLQDADDVKTSTYQIPYQQPAVCMLLEFEISNQDMVCSNERWFRHIDIVQQEDDNASWAKRACSFLKSHDAEILAILSVFPTSRAVLF